jgi:hypothetical protein
MLQHAILSRLTRYPWPRDNSFPSYLRSEGLGLISSITPPPLLARAPRLGQHSLLPLTTVLFKEYLFLFFPP